MNNSNIIDITPYKSVSQTERHAEKTSERYSFIPTTRVLGVLADYGWQPSKVIEARTRKNQGFQKHIVRLRQEGVTGEEIPEIVLFNSHMGSAAFKLMSGIFRLICGNGLIVGDTWESHSIRHVGYTDELVESAAKALSVSSMKAIGQVERFRAIELSRPERIAFGEAAVALVNDGEKFTMQPDALLGARRWDDRASDLWTTLNVVQENVIRGGVRRVNSDGRRARTRAVASADGNIKLNQALWTLAEKMAEIKAAQ